MPVTPHGWDGLWPSRATHKYTSQFHCGFLPACVLLSRCELGLIDPGSDLPPVPDPHSAPQWSGRPHQELQVLNMRKLKTSHGRWTLLSGWSYTCFLFYFTIRDNTFMSEKQGPNKKFWIYVDNMCKHFLFAHGAVLFLRAYKRSSLFDMSMPGD